MTAILSLIAIIPILGSIASKLFKGVGKAGSKFMKYLNSTGITEVITNWLKQAADSLSDVFKGGKIDLSAKNRQLVAEYLGNTRKSVQSNVEWLAGKKKVTGDSTKITKKTTDAGKRVSKFWNEAKKKIKETKGKGVNTQTASKEDAERLINEARPELEKRPTYSKGGKSGYEFHPAEPEVGNDKLMLNGGIGVRVRQKVQRDTFIMIKRRKGVVKNV